MGVRTTESEGSVALVDSVSGFAFGPTFDSGEDAQSFLDFLRGFDDRDPRVMPDRDMELAYRAWKEDRLPNY